MRHIDRCRLLLHLVDVSGSEGRYPVEDVETINAELAGYSEFLAARPQIIVANKTDLLGEDRSAVERLKAYADEKGFAFLEPVSLQPIRVAARFDYEDMEALQELPPVFVYEPEFVEVEEEITERDITIEKVEDYYVVGGAWIDKIMGSVNVDDYESRQ